MALRQLLVSVCVATFVESLAAASCGLYGTGGVELDPVTVLPITSDNLERGVLIWDTTTFGSVDKTAAESSPEYKYISGFSQSQRYWFSANDKTKDFTRERKTRTISRTITVYCNDPDNSTVKYSFSIPLQDMTKPVFSEDLYTLSITSDWDPNQPISVGQFVIVSDNAYELQNGALSYFTTVENSLNITSVKLWWDEYPARYYYRLDLFILPDFLTTLEPGSVTQIGISARDDFNSGSTIVEINVTE